MSQEQAFTADDLDDLLSGLSTAPATAPATASAPATPTAPPPKTTTLSLNPERQKTYIIDNAPLLDVMTKRTILSLIMMEIGETAILENSSSDQVETNVDLDIVTERNPEVLTSIYNIVRARRDALDQPARAVDRAPRPAARQTPRRR
jgi:hypothetical protein